MEGTEELWDEYFTELEAAKVALKEAQQLLVKVEKPMATEELMAYQRRHKQHLRTFYQHLRTFYQHLRKSRRIRRKIDRIEKKASKVNGR